MTFILRLSLGFVLLEASSATAARPSSPSVRLEGMDYEKARAIVQGFGWRPYSTKCGGPPVDDQTCARYPELGYCQGNGRGFCHTTFARRGRCLSLLTVESPPGKGYTIIYRVDFSRAPCAVDTR